MRGPELSKETHEIITRMIDQGVNPDHIVALCASVINDTCNGVKAMLITPRSNCVH